ncbi:hypothetical protein [uncultured Dysosmobacter sp.]|uniref:hypothetical protein n=1 Tax=uncultured Dysosmobacter sp. TaxID=2591384 RepID=UPI00261E5626|nr:hypothetical protein [uncultured Dysosmobacter sp.]
MKTVKITLAGQDYYLTFNGVAMFALEDVFGGNNAYFEKSAVPGREGFEAVCKAAAILAEQGELARRALGYDKGPIPTEEHLMTCSAPVDLLRLRQANLAAIVAGYGREVESDGPVDLELLELDRKRGKD